MSDIQPQELGKLNDIWTDIILGKDTDAVIITDDSCNTCKDQLIHHNEIMLKLTTNQRRFHKVAEKNEKKLNDEISVLKAELAAPQEKEREANQRLHNQKEETAKCELALD